jgi:eukaryotic-like serine/threonine-protein kinase
MTPERWQQVEKLYHAVLEREPSQRAAFLQRACAGNEELRQEVESLLDY